MSGSEASKVHYYIDEKWDNAIDITMRSVFYGSLIGAVGGLFLLRGKTARVASLAFGAGFGAGGAYYQNQKAYEALWRSSGVKLVKPVSSSSDSSPKQ
ncbi:hypothetical protein ACKKBG_A20190 [Auxenochlorella protothecoides x Auxenochlorella symbiontica]